MAKHICHVAGVLNLDGGQRLGMVPAQGRDPMDDQFFSWIDLLPTQQMYRDCESIHFESDSITRATLTWENPNKCLD